MRIFSFLPLLLMLPFTWISAIRCRKKEFMIRYLRLRKWCVRFLKLFVIPLEIIQKEDLPEGVPLYFVSNHQGTLDPLVLVATLPQPFTFISKIENENIPILASWSKSIELIYFDREDTNSAVHMLREASRCLRANRNVLVFPEGTRSKGMRMLPMKAGALKPAYLGKATIVPIAQKNSYETKKILLHGLKLRVVIGKPIPYEDYKDMDIESLCIRLQATIQSYVDQI